MDWIRMGLSFPTPTFPTMTSLVFHFFIFHNQIKIKFKYKQIKKECQYWDRFMEILLNAIIPLFCIILIGYLAEKFHILGQSSFKILNEFVIKFPLPILIFSSIAGKHIKEIFNLPFMGRSEER